MEYTAELKVKLRVRDVEDQFEAIQYFDEFIYGLHSLTESYDENDDHYRIDESHVEDF